MFLYNDTSNDNHKGDEVSTHVKSFQIHDHGTTIKDKRKPSSIFCTIHQIIVAREMMLLLTLGIFNKVWWGGGSNLGIHTQYNIKTCFFFSFTPPSTI